MNRSLHFAAIALLATSPLGGCGPKDEPDPPSANMKVNARSGGDFDLANTTWTRCEAGWPYAGQSYWHAWIFGEGTATIRHDVYTESTDCTGATDPAEHFEVAMTLEITGGDRTVGWEGDAPVGYPPTLVATGVTFGVTAYGFTEKGVAYVDDTRGPAWLFVTNPGDTPEPPRDADGYPTIMGTLEHARP